MSEVNKKWFENHCVIREILDLQTNLLRRLNEKFPDRLDGVRWLSNPKINQESVAVQSEALLAIGTDMNFDRPQNHPDTRALALEAYNRSVEIVRNYEKNTQTK